MFYSETLLSKTGPLARVWLAANLERKVTKTHVLQSNIETSVNAIVDQGQAPLALRLSGQLLLGVVRIYSKKARYLLDDCNEALNKIKMAFRPGNVDLPTHQSHAANPASLTLPDALTELDLLGPMGDPSLLLSDDFDGILDGRDPTLLDMGSSQRLPSSIERGRGGAAELLPRLEDDLDLDLNFGDDPVTPQALEREIESGRDAPASRTRKDEPSQLFDDDLDLNLGDSGIDQDNDTTLKFGQSNLGNDIDIDMNMGGMDEEFSLPNPGEATPPPPNDPNEETIETNGDSTFITQTAEESVHLPQRAKKRKVLQADADTEIHSSQIKAQQTDRSRILKPASYLPRDPLLFALMNMQKSGEFVSSLLGDGRSRGWAPELRGILSLEVVRKSSDLKRKRDSGVAGIQNTLNVSPRIEQSGLQTTGSDRIEDIDDEMSESRVRFEDDEIARPFDTEIEGFNEPAENFEDTTMPLLHPKDSGAISLGTKHAVHLLRDVFGPEAEDSPAKRQQSIFFHDLLPEETTTRTDATKMFFEVLVLATKDAIKVEQKEDTLGGDLRIRGKRGLWGAWAETEAGGEIQSQEVVAEAAAAVI